MRGKAQAVAVLAHPTTLAPLTDLSFAFNNIHGRSTNLSGVEHHLSSAFQISYFSQGPNSLMFFPLSLFKTL